MKARAPLQAKPAAQAPSPKQPTLPRASARDPEEDHEKAKPGPLGAGLLRRHADGHGDAGVAPTSVHETLGSPGRSLEAPVRSGMEAAFGHDFRRVRIHDDARASRSAQEIGALAYTVGRDVVFRAGLYAPRTPRGRTLLAHELAHVVQQEYAPLAQAKLAVAPAGTPLEREADAAAARVASGGRARVLRRVGAGGIHRMGCWELLNAKEAARVSGNAAHAEIKRVFRKQVKGAARTFQIPTGSFAPYRDESWTDPNVIPSVGIGGPREGVGTPDLALKRGSVMELAEVKPATWGWLADGGTQLANYLAKANDDEALKARLGVTAFVPMMPTSFHLPSTVTVEGRRAHTVWCGPGMIVYKVVAKKKKKDKKGKKKGKKPGKGKGKKPGGKLGKGGKMGGAKALAWANAIAAVVLLTKGAKVQASPGGGEMPLETLIRVMIEQGVEVPPDLRERIQEDPELAALAEQSTQAGRSTEEIRARTRRVLEIIQQNPDEFTDEDLKALLEAQQAAAGDDPGVAPSLEGLRALIGQRKSGAPPGGEAGKADGGKGEPGGKGGKGKGAAKEGKGGAPGGTTAEGAAEGKGGEGDAGAAPAVSPKMRERLAASPLALRLYRAVATAKVGPASDDAFVQGLLDAVAQADPPLTAEQVEAIASRTASAEGETAEQVLATIRAAIAARPPAAGAAPPADAQIPPPSDVKAEPTDEGVPGPAAGAPPTPEEREPDYSWIQPGQAFLDVKPHLPLKAGQALHGVPLDAGPSTALKKGQVLTGVFIVGRSPNGLLYLGHVTVRVDKVLKNGEYDITVGSATFYGRDGQPLGEVPEFRERLLIQDGKDEPSRK